MGSRARNAFEGVPHTVWGHFRLNFYAGVDRLLTYLYCLSELGGEELETIFERYRFLAGYFAEIQQYLPEDIGWEDAYEWWEAEITDWEKTSDEPLPLLALAEQGGIDFRSRIALMVAGLVEEDSRFGTVFAWLQEPLTYRRPCLELVGQIMKDGSLADCSDAWSMCHPLLSAGLIQVANRDTPRSEWLLRVPSVLWDVIKGEIATHPAPWCQYFAPETFPLVKDLIFPEEFLAQLAHVPTLVDDSKTDAVVLRGMQGSEQLQVLGAVARSLDRGIVEVKDAMSSAEQHWELLGPLCTMTRSIPVIMYDLGPGETAEVPLLTGYQGFVGVIMGFEGGLSGPTVERAVVFSLPVPKVAQRRRYWQEALAGYSVEDLAEISERFHIPGGYIRQAGATAIALATLAQRKTITADDIRAACRTLNRQLLDTLATRLEVEGTWKRLVVNEGTAAKLNELERRCHHREGLLEYLGPGFGSGCNRGVRALFTGASGTGKTLAAKILAAELGMDLYRVDLAAVVNKYIGETEKNLHRVLSRAEELDVILLLDEGDALLGARTEVRSANDRYANLETNYLLQRLENYQGIVLVTTNAGQNIDSAFQRRMDVVVHFVPPQADERLLLWQLHLPENHTVDPAYLEEVATRCAFTGGQVRNAVLHATVLALDSTHGVVTRWHLEEGIQSEYRKAGAISPLSNNGLVREDHGGMEAFLDILSS